MNDEAKQDRLIQALNEPACYPHPVKTIRHIETHISHLLLTGDYAYKIKKPLDLGFLDFSTLEKRRFYCEEELRLNRRLAPTVYLAVVALNGDLGKPRFGHDGPPLEYAVKMRQFDSEATLDELDARGQLELSHIDAIAEVVAAFHRTLTPAPSGSAWGTAESIWQPVEQNFAQIAARVSHHAKAQSLLAAVHRWSEGENAKLRANFEQRRAEGFIRECHGDLHLGNMAWDNGAPLIFDCIEFSPALRWIDVMSEVAFCYMDLRHRGHADFASRFLNRYLELTGDYGGLRLLRFYAVYRAMVRAKIGFIRASQPGLSPQEANHATEQALAYLRLAEHFTTKTPPRLLITHGLSGSGKTVFSRQLMLQQEMICLRSDVERKRLAGLGALTRTDAALESGIYGRDFSRRTYEHLGKLAETLLTAGWNVLVDATFIAHWQREAFRQIASRTGVAFSILDFVVPEEDLRRRVRLRGEAGTDASEANLAVLDHQLKSQEPLTAAELEQAIPATSLDDVLARLTG